MVQGWLSSSDSKSVILSGWRAAGITNALEKGLADFAREILDLYSKVDPFDQEDIDFDMRVVTTPHENFIAATFNYLDFFIF